MPKLADDQVSLLARVQADGQHASAELQWAEQLRKRAETDRQWAMQQQDQVLADCHQSLLDAEVRATRQALLRALHRRAGRQATAILDEDFLAVADQPTLCRAIVDIALRVSDAAAVDLQLYDSCAQVLRIASQRGFTRDFLGFFATVHASQPTACTTALATRTPVLVDDIAKSAIFRGQPTREPLLDAGSRAVYSYPLLRTGRAALGVLSFHHHSGSLDGHESRELVRRSAAQALTRLQASA